MENLPEASGIPIVPAYRGETIAEKRRIVPQDENLPYQIFAKIDLSQIAANSADISDILPELSSESPEIELINQKVEMYAVDFGYKGANLFILEEIAAILRGLGWKVYVPKFLAISHSQNQAHLQKHCPSLEDDWNHFILCQRGKQELTEEGREVLQKMRAGVRDAFHEHPIDLDLTRFEQSKRLMVRSSGHEDSKEASMAGAHTSISGVTKDVGQISKAIGAVIESYLGETSILQKLAAGHNAFFAPVLIQEMIGEEMGELPKPDEMLRCGICYTKEMGAETLGLTAIESAYGHNELVVNGGSCDLYFVYSNGENHQILEPKPTRLVAHVAQDGESKFVRKQNPHELVNIGSLSKEALKLIQVCSSEIHEAYGCIMDIEWIYDPNENTLWLVQARPVVKKIVFEPSMVDKSTLTKYDQGHVIVHQGGKAIALTKREQLICARTLGNGCLRYLKLGKENPVRAVIVSEPSGRLSHPACVLREKGVIVMHCPSFDLHSMDKPGTVTLIDTQQGIIGQIKDFDFNEAVIKEGWFKHPIAAQESLQDYGLDEASIRELLSNLTDGHVVESQDVSEFITMLGSEDIEEGNRAVKDLTFALLKFLKSMSHDSPLEKHLFEEGVTLLRNILVLGNQLLGRTERKQRLHTAKRLEALCYQEGSSRVLHSLSVRTLLSKQKLARTVTNKNIPLSKETQAGLKLLETMTRTRLQRMGTPATVLHALKEPLTESEKAHCQLVYQSMLPLTIGDQCKVQWQKFTNVLLATESRMANQLCMDLLTQIEKSGILTEWMMHSFAPCASRVQDAVGILQALRDEWGKARKTMKEVIQLSTTLETWKHNPTIWEDSATFNALWMAFQFGPVKELQKAVDHLLSRQDFTALEKVLLCNVIREGIETFDTAIKTMRGKADQKVDHFAKMLIPYHAIMARLFEAIPDKIFSEWTSSALVDNKQLTLSSYKAGILALMKFAFDRCCKNLNGQLDPSESFNVQAACINSGAFFNLEFDKNRVTLEDLFTLFHQNILASLECHRPRLDQAKLPQEAQEILAILGSIDDKTQYSHNIIKLQTHLIGESIRYPMLICTYNLPIKNHSSKLIIEYNLKTRQTEVSFEIYGHNMNQRLELIGAKVIFKSAMEGVRLIEFPFYDGAAQTLKMKWQLENNAELLKKLIIEAAKDTLIGNFGTISIVERNILPGLNEIFWENLLSNPGSFKQVFDGPAQYTILSILEYFLSKECTVSTTLRCSLVAEIGVPVRGPQEGETFEKCLFEGFCTHLLHDKESLLMEQVGFMMLPINPVKRLLIKLLDHLLMSEEAQINGFRDAIGQNYAILLPKGGTYPTDEDHFFVMLTETFTRCCIKSNDLGSIKACAQFMSENKQTGCLRALLNVTEVMGSVINFSEGETYK